MARDAKSDMFLESLGQKVRAIRLEMDLTQNQVAEALHVTPGYISNVENNRTAMSLRVLTYYAKLTNRTLDAVVGLVDDEYAQTALENEVAAEIHKLSDADKKKILKTIRLWKAD